MEVKENYINMHREHFQMEMSLFSLNSKNGDGMGGGEDGEGVGGGQGVREVDQIPERKSGTSALVSEAATRRECRS